MTDKNPSQNQEYFSVLGNTPRKSRFDPDLARRVNERVEREEKLEELRKKREALQGKTNQPETSKPLVIPDLNTQYSFLSRDLGKQVDELVHQRYPGIKAIDKINYNPELGLVKGSNPFYVIAVNEVLRELYPDNKIRTASQVDLERILETGSLELRNQYEDSALILRSEDEPNEYLAKDLMKQVKAKNLNLKMPLMLPLNSLRLRKDSNSPHKLSFELTDLSELIYCPILNKKGDNFLSQDIDEKTGLPNKLNSNGERILYIAKEGLSRLYLIRNLDLSSGYESLVNSYSSGRIVVVNNTSTKNQGGIN